MAHFLPSGITSGICVAKEKVDLYSCYRAS